MASDTSQITDNRINSVGQQKPSILYIAVHELNAYWGAETFLASAFEALGHKVIRLDYRAHRTHISAKLEAARSSSPDIVLLQRGEGFPCHLLSVIPAPKVYYATEGAWNPEQRLVLQEKLFDAYVAASRTTLEFMIRDCQVPRSRAHHIPSGYDPRTYSPLSIDKPYNVAAVFNWNFRRRFAFWHLWRIQRRQKFSGIYGADCNHVINQSRVVVNIHRTTTLDTETRLFELLPTTAAIVSEVCDSPELFRDSGIQWFPPGDWLTMRKLVRQLVNDDGLRQVSVQRNNEVAARHTWQSRAVAFDEIFRSLLR